MNAFFLFLLYQLAFFGDVSNDPVNEAWKGREAARQFECERMSQAAAHQQFPGTIPAPSIRGGALMQVDALVCERRIVADGVRAPREELILGRLTDEVGQLSGLAATAVGDDKTQWVVEAFYPNPVMVRKISGATRSALAERGLKVSDQPPRWTAGDVEVFRTLPMRDAIPLACRRLFASQHLDPSVVFLAIALLHEKESQLHAGTCKEGVFTWLR